ncbi:exodeoxyribonuclease VII small subunit [Nitratireductor thuwali]|uniref:Exodeoxyribonuclease 7 small subunit n=1 Tax=Nitratireductor thuwali TaxID=2267699 RepID=A0ABY5MSD0_9HYPH|nr:Exodeoxyribonuclease 7 small subunit [Nitratireductor thuwali]
MIPETNIGETTTAEANKDIKAMSFEQALEALENIVNDLERGDVPLEQSIRIYERGEALKAHCDKLLKAAEDKVEKIRLSREGQAVGVEPLDPQ